MEPFVESITSSRFESLNPSFDLCKDFSQKKPGNSDFNSKNSKSVEFEGYQEAVETAGSPRSGSVKWGIHENPETVRSKADWDVENIFSEIKRTCVDCQTSKTPLWRSGPAGPKSLCNACGIRYRKKRRAALGLNTEKEKERKKNAGVSLKLRLLALGGDFFVQKKRKLAKEEEEAAVLLMALSGGFLHA